MDSCSCSFFAVYGLPCQHIFAVRKHIGDVLISPNLIPKRWRINQEPEIVDSKSEISNISPVKTVFMVKKDKQQNSNVKKILSERAKFNISLDFMKDFSSFLAAFGHNEFYEKLNALKQLKLQWQR